MVDTAGKDILARAVTGDRGYMIVRWGYQVKSTVKATTGVMMAGVIQVGCEASRIG